jgi:hypothetical protein
MNAEELRSIQATLMRLTERHCVVVKRETLHKREAMT